MSKVLRIAAVVVGAVAVIATGGALLGPALKIGAKTLATLGTVAKVATIAATGLSLAAQLTARQPPTPGAIGNPTDWKADPFAGLPYTMGETLVGGNIVFRQAQDAFSDDTPNDLQTFVTVLSAGGPIESVLETRVDRAATSFDNNTGVTFASGYSGFLWSKYQLGARPEASALAITAGSSAMPFGWTSAHKLSGLAAVMTRMRFDSKGDIFKSGEPPMSWLVRGVRCYDPRKDSTYPGGSGAHRWNDETTWEWTRNPYLHGLTWCIGRRTPSGRLVCGLGAHVDEIVVEQFVEGANVADANDWYCDGQVYTRPTSAWSNLRLILQAGGGQPVPIGARIGCIVPMPRVSLKTIGPDELRGRARVRVMNGPEVRRNQGFARFRSPDNDWQMVDIDVPVTVADWVTADGEERPMTREYTLVENAAQAAQLITYELADSREASPIETPLGPAFMGYKAGDLLTLNTPEVAGMPFLVLERSINPETAEVVLKGRSETPGKHDLALGRTASAPPAAGLGTFDPSVVAPGASAWSATGTALSAGGTSVPALVLSGAVDNPNADGVIIEYRVNGATTWNVAGVEPPGMARKEITAVTPGTAYDLAVSYRVRGVIGSRRVLGPVTAGNAAVVWGNVGGVGRPEDGATRGDNIQPNALMLENADGYVNAGAWERVAAPAGWPVPFVWQNTVTDMDPVTALQFPLIPIDAYRNLYQGILVERDGSVGRLQVALVWYDIVGAARGEVGGAVRTAIPTAANEIQLIESGGLVPEEAVAVRIWVYLLESAAVGSVRVGSPRVATSQQGADVTAQNAPRLDAPGAQDVLFSFTGDVALAGQLPRVLSFKRFRGAADVTATSTWAVSAVNCTASVTSAGVVTVTAVAGNGSVIVTATRDGVPVSATVPINKVNAAAPPPAGSSTASGDVSFTTGSGSFVVARETTVTTSAGGSSITVSASLQVIGSLGYAPTEAVWQIFASGSWSDISPGAAASEHYVISEFGIDFGFIGISRTVGSLTGTTTYPLRLLVRRASGSGDQSFSGSFTAEAA